MKLRVSIWGMYDCHLFHKYTGSSVDEVLENWQNHIEKLIPAQFSDGTKVEDLGPTALCPAIVLDGNRELRRVGKMIFADYKTRRPARKDLQAYRRALLADPDISNILLQGE